MRTLNFGTGRLLRTAAGLAIAGSALAMAPLAPAFAEDSTPLPAADAVEFDASLSVRVPHHTLEGQTGVAYFSAKSTVPTASYAMKIRVPSTAELGYIGGLDPKTSWYCTKISFNGLDCVWRGAATAQTKEISVNYVFTSTKKATVTTTLSTTEKDTNPANNKNVSSWIVVLKPATGTILGHIFDDRNGDGVQQQSEPGIGNHDVYLVSTNAGVHNPNWQHVRTRFDGSYIFDELTPSKKPDAYKVYAGSPSSKWKWTKPTVAGSVLNLRPMGKGEALPEALRKDKFPKTGKVAVATVLVRGGRVQAVYGSLAKVGAPAAGMPAPTPSGTPTLPTTGASVQAVALGGGAFLLAGLGLAGAARRRRTA